ncbi:MAG TPA: N-acetylmuramoyl-L-alanine amidase [Bacteroidales bacterium]|nr:N-acetylmuramoyl-L-alanine amidase [Bacteroidales bacterium]HOH83510.1 N-acetylmuramoyl-L-alanine amidase [Bacteroidales bacterium]
MKRNNLIFVLLALMILGIPGYVTAQAIKIRKVVIDAGHGGDDPGAVGKKAREKDITLSVALKIGNYIKTAFPDIEIVYTRKTDVFVELYKRAKIANDHKADLFISIHCNASKSPEPVGTESWVMGLHKSQANLEVAKKENAAILYENDYSVRYDGFDPNSPEANIIFSLYQNAYLDQSLTFSSFVQNQFTSKAGRFSRGVKQAGFLVLYKTTMPGALIEIGFISNPTEELYLMSESGQNIIASAIYRAFKEYKANVEGVAGKQEVKTEPDTIFQKITVSDTSPVVNNTDTLSRINETKDNSPYFRVQFLSSSRKKSLDVPEFKGLDNVRYYVQNGIYKYTCGNFNTLKEAITYQHVVQNKGFKDAFVVAFLNEERISPTEALKYSGN